MQIIRKLALQKQKFLKISVNLTYKTNHRWNRGLIRMFGDVCGLLPGIILCGVWFLIMDILFGKICAARILFGIPCPGCGLTRAAVLLVKGHFLESFRMHPLLPAVIIGVGYYLFLTYFTDRSLPYAKIWISAGVILFLAVYFIRIKLYFPSVEPMNYDPGNYFQRLIHIYSTNI